jgi:hypothetical protein
MSTSIFTHRLVLQLFHAYTEKGGLTEIGNLSAVLQTRLDKLFILSSVSVLIKVSRNQSKRIQQNGMSFFLIS